MVDLTQTSIHKEHDRFIQLLDKTVQYAHPLPTGEEEQAETKGDVLFMRNNGWTSESSEQYAVYTYPQSLINRNSNKPFFVASPKLFALMADDEQVETKKVAVNGEDVTAREIMMNGQAVEVVKLGQIADVKVGLQTGDNDSYLYQNPEARGTYRDINEYQDKLLTEEDLKTIQNDEELRLSVIKHGISKDDSSSDRYFGGQYIIPYDKGGASDASGGWMPNYWVPTDYFIDWSEWAVKRMKNKTSNKQGGKVASRMQNREYYFIPGLTWSDAGFYSPTLRLSGNGIFDVKGSRIVSDFDRYTLIGVLTSKLMRLLIKSMNNTTVSTQVDDFRELPINVDLDVSAIVKEIFRKQKSSQYYDFASNEKIKIDALVYRGYGLDNNDIKEVENWNARRYSKLVKAQKENLAKQGKPIDYIELYAELEEEAEKDI
jgi:hypothetical protein